MAAQSTIVFADMGSDVPQAPSAVAASIARQAHDSLAAGQYDVALKPMTTDEVREAIRAMPTGHGRLSLDRDLVLLDAGALLALAPYNARVVLTRDPFVGAEMIAGALGLDVDSVRVRIHDALLSASKVVCLGSPAFEAVTPLVSRKPEERMFPPTALTLAATGGAILVINNEDERAGQDLIAALADAFPSEDFRAFDPASVFETPWRAMIQNGIARSSLPGARLGDAWAGAVPVLQLANQASLMAHNRRQGTLADLVVEHGRTGLLFSSTDELFATLRDLLLDPLPGRSVARAARRKVDPPAQWDALLRVILQ